MITEKLGQRIRTLRQNIGISQEKFALLIGLDRTYFASVDSEKEMLQLSILKKLQMG